MKLSKDSTKASNNADFAAAFFAFAHGAGPHCRLRFAPTPSGYLHLGNALNFILNWLPARLNGGKILLRIDDLDADRKRPEYIADVFESLQWLGLDYDEGPHGEDFEPQWSQHQRVLLYARALETLKSAGCLFPCKKSRNDLAPFGGRYPAEFRQQNLDFSDPDVAWRVKTGPEMADLGMADFVVRRRDGLPAYQIASLVDDLHFGITHIVRGEDLAASTAAQRFLARLLHADAFLQIPVLHHLLMLDEQGNKLSKSAGATSLRAMREHGQAPAFVFESAARLLNLPPVATAGELLASVRQQIADNASA